MGAPRAFDLTTDCEQLGLNPGWLAPVEDGCNAPFDIGPGFLPVSAQWLGATARRLAPNFKNRIDLATNIDFG
jgi:hypothetical protein